MVDNASTDDTIAEVARRGVQVDRQSDQSRFRRRGKSGFHVLKYHICAAPEPRCCAANNLEPLREACDLPGAAGAGGRLLDPDGRPQIGFMVRAISNTGAPSFWKHSC